MNAHTKTIDSRGLFQVCLFIFMGRKPRVCCKCCELNPKTEELQQQQTTHAGQAGTQNKTHTTSSSYRLTKTLFSIFPITKFNKIGCITKLRGIAQSNNKICRPISSRNKNRPALFKNCADCTIFCSKELLILLISLKSSRQVILCCN